MTRMLVCRDWAEHQSYRRDRGPPPWIKIRRDITRHRKWLRLTEVQRAHLVSVWLIAADTNGIIEDDPDLIRRQCGLDTLPDLDALVAGGWLDPVDDASVRHDDASVTPTRRHDDASVTPTRRHDDASVTPTRRHDDAPEAEAEAEKPGGSPPETTSIISTARSSSRANTRATPEQRFRNRFARLSGTERETADQARERLERIARGEEP